MNDASATEVVDRKATEKATEKTTGRAAAGDPTAGAPAPVVEAEVDPAEVGFDAERLAEVGRHLHAYVDDGRLPGTYVLVSRGGKTAYVDRYGRRDCERDLPVDADTIYRIYSMTKPLTSIAAMQLYERGMFQLKDPVSRWLPAFGDARVFAGGNATLYQTREPAREITVHDLLTHTSGLTYDFHFAGFVDELYRRNGFNWGMPGDLAESCDALAALPLLFDPGTEWNYSYSTDVLGRLVEVLSGQNLDLYLKENVIGPLAMVDTGFSVPPESAHRLASNYAPAPGTLRRTVVDAAETSAFLKPPKTLSGGGGLVSTMADYHRFTQMLRGGGTLEGRRVIGSRTLAYMTQNHLPGGGDLTACGRALFSEAAFDGVGFGLGFSVVLDPAKAQVLSSKGEFAWGGAASTAFWVDPVEDLTVVFLTQLLPSSTHPIRAELKALVYQALV
ncbi:MAG TPA: serine hydrolase [Acidimicrobiaceae bacterium]|nr:serine hydrolase [Acidimicrobiaceae bacterium]HCB37108.1 serine hydrolase [Acidimicrobiaceae bacterium]